ncbi:MAG: PIN domain nuclease [Spirochaetota bacterium]
MVLVDTSAWIDYFTGVAARHTDAVHEALTTDRVVIGDIIIAELLQGFRSDSDYRQASALIERLEYRDLVGRSIALKAADNYRTLRAGGITVRKTIDLLIATYCIENDLPLIHNDRDFDLLEEGLGLGVVRAPDDSE